MHTNNKLLEKYGNWALITGASSGIGKGFVKALLVRDINCVLVSENQNELEATKAELSLLSNKKIELIVCDFRKEDNLAALLNHPLIAPCKIIVNCAGIGMMGYFIQHNADSYEEMHAINLKAPLMLTHYFCHKFYKEKTRGAIINISSANAELHYPIPFSAVYSAEKSMIKYMTEAIAYEMKSFGIDILCVSCGPVKTAFQAKAGSNVLSWCETPDHVAEQSLKALGNKPYVVTNHIAHWLIRCFKWIPFPRQVRMNLVSWFFGKVLAKKSQIRLEE